MSVLNRDWRCGHCGTTWRSRTAEASLPCPSCGGRGQWIDRVAEAMPADQITVVSHASAGETPSEAYAVLRPLVQRHQTFISWPTPFEKHHARALDQVLTEHAELTTEVARLRERVTAISECYTLPNGECISPFDCVHGDGLSLDEFVTRLRSSVVVDPTPRAWEVRLGVMRYSLCINKGEAERDAAIGNDGLAPDEPRFTVVALHAAVLPAELDTQSRCDHPREEHIASNCSGSAGSIHWCPDCGALSVASTSAERRWKDAARPRG